MQRILAGKTAVITGANGGIGKAIVRLFAQNGANIIACVRLKHDDTINFFKNIENDYNVELKVVSFDMSNTGAIKEGISAIKSFKLPVDILINNAGIPHLALVPMTKIEDMQKVFQVNYFAQIQFIQGLFTLITRSHGCIINMASIAGIDGEIGNAVYGATKASMIILTKVLSKEMSRFHVRVNAIAPGLTDTNFAEKMGDSAKKSMINTSLFHRLSTPEEIAKTALFLASENSSFITGQVIRVDGGI